MVMVADLLPGLKRFLSGTGLQDAGLRMVMRMMVTFLLHSRRVSCLQAAGAVRSDVRHRAQMGLSASDRAESETPNVLRSPGKAQRTLGRRGAAGLFDSESSTRQGNTRRRENPDDEQPKFSAREIAELYSLRWQIELFFKELKSTLGFHQYQFRDFQCVENWCELTLLAFLYLENLRARQLARRGLSEKDKNWWRHQRTHGLCQAVRLASQQNELEYLAKRLETPGGIQKLKRLLQASFPTEYRAAM